MRAMQLQAERDHFVHSGIGGGSSSSSSSSSSPSCSPPKDSLLSLIKVKNLKNPRSEPKLNNTDRSAEKQPTAAKYEEDMTMDMDPPSDKNTQKSLDSCCSTALANEAGSAATDHSMDVSDSARDWSLPISGTSAVETIVASTISIDQPTAQDIIASEASQPESHLWTSNGQVPALQDTAMVGPEAQPPRSQDELCSTVFPSPPALIAQPLFPHTFIQPCSTVGASSIASSGMRPVTGYATDRLSRLPLELFFNVLCQLDALDLSRIAQVNKFFARMASDDSVWRVKSIQHPLFSERHFQGRLETLPWLAYYKFLHRNGLAMKRNWADARPQAVHVLEGHAGLVSALELNMWSLVTVSMDSTLRIWDLRTLQCMKVLEARHSLTCVSQAVNAGAACARTSFGGLCIWDTRTGELILQDDTAMPQIASFIYMDERYIGYGQCDGAVTVFDWSSRNRLEIVGNYHAHEGDVIHVSILNRKYVISASTNGETLVYSLEQSCVVERILLPHASQAIQFTPTIHGDKVMFSTRDAVYEYDLMLDHLRSGHSSSPSNSVPTSPTSPTYRLSSGQSIGKDNHISMSASSGNSEGFVPTLGSMVSLRPPPPQSSSTRTPYSGRVWKTSNSLLSQIRQRVGGTEQAHDQERLIIPTRFPRQASICCVPRTSRTLDHGTTSARDSYGVFMPNHCTRLNEICVYTRTTKQVRPIHGPAVDGVLAEAFRNRFYTTMECNQHCAVVSSGNKVYVISFLPPGV